jgi:2-dehydro-3-deoxyglucarate aldolase/4-hydroxy-2-oxoheptanedioate aldolase
MIVEFNVRGLAKILEAAGIDFAFIDMEHGAFSHTEVADLVTWFKATPLAVFVRVPVGTYPFIARVLETGAAGVMIPNVDTAAQARAAVEAAKFRPLGRRGVSFASAVNDYVDVDDLPPYMREMNAQTIVICQIESAEGLEQADDIAATDGVNILWLGQYDLTASLGIVGEFEHPRFQEAVKHVIATAHRHGKLAGIQSGSVTQLHQWKQWGFDVVSLGEDLGIYMSTINRAVRELRHMLTR